MPRGAWGGRRGLLSNALCRSERGARRGMEGGAAAQTLGEPAAMSRKHPPARFTPVGRSRSHLRRIGLAARASITLPREAFSLCNPPFRDLPTITRQEHVGNGESAIL